MAKTPSERINLIQGISKKLKENEWGIIDLTLRQFSLPTQETWSNGDREGYIITMISSASDETLAQLSYHLSGEKGDEYNSGTVDFWQPGQFRVFLSHVSAHKIKASEIKEKLEKFHISTFVAHEDISPTKEWQDEIELALETMDCLVALVTDDFHSSNWTDQELGIAIGKRKLIIPINCGGSPYGFLSKYQWPKSLDMDADAMSKLVFRILTKNSLSKKKFSEALVNKFESSFDFQNAKDNMSLLEKVDYLDSDLISRINNAHNTNFQIRESFGVTNRIEKLIKRIQQS